MPRFSVLVLILLTPVVLNPGEVSAQGDLGFAAGPTFATGSATEVESIGLHAGVVGRLAVPVLPVALRGDLMIQHFPEVIRPGGESESATQLFATVNARLALLGPLDRFYISGGPGIYTDMDDISPTVGLNVGLGAEFGTGVFRPFVETRYHFGAGGDIPSFVPLTFGIFF